MTHIYVTGGGEELDLELIEKLYPDSLGLLRQETVRCTDLEVFRSRTSHYVIRTARRAAGHTKWQADPLYRLQLDLTVQLGVVLGQTVGTNTESFLRFRAGT